MTVMCVLSDRPNCLVVYVTITFVILSNFRTKHLMHGVEFHTNFFEMLHACENLSDAVINVSFYFCNEKQDLQPVFQNH